MTNHYENSSNHNHTVYEVASAIDTPETTPTPIESLIEQFGFHPTSALMEANEAIIAGLADETTDRRHLRQAWIEYSKIAEGIVEATGEDPVSYAKAQVAANIHKALLFQAIGDMLRYLHELDLAQLSASMYEFREVKETLQAEVDEKVDTLEMSSEVLVIKLRGVISIDNRLFLYDLLEQGGAFEDIVGHAYGMLLEEGEDPDEVLAEIGAIER